jgi:hypothetical protein
MLHRMTEGWVITVIFVCTGCGSLYEADQGAVTLPTVGHFRCRRCDIEVYRWCGVATCATPSIHTERGPSRRLEIDLPQKAEIVFR